MVNNGGKPQDDRYFSTFYCRICIFLPIFGSDPDPHNYNPESGSGSK